MKGIARRPPDAYAGRLLELLGFPSIELKMVLHLIVTYGYVRVTSHIERRESVSKKLPAPNPVIARQSQKASSRSNLPIASFSFNCK